MSPDFKIENEQLKIKCGLEIGHEIESQALDTVKGTKALQYRRKDVRLLVGNKCDRE